MPTKTIQIPVDIGYGEVGAVYTKEAREVLANMTNKIWQLEREAAGWGDEKAKKVQETKDSYIVVMGHLHSLAFGHDVRIFRDTDDLSLGIYFRDSGYEQHIIWFRDSETWSVHT
jgi:hypothetical protein